MRGAQAEHSESPWPSVTGKERLLTFAACLVDTPLCPERCFCLELKCRTVETFGALTLFHSPIHPHEFECFLSYLFSGQ